jgi:putative transposase
MASGYRAFQSQLRELRRLFGNKMLEAMILREALEHASLTQVRSAGEDVPDLMVAAVEFGLVNRPPVTMEWLSGNGSCYVAGETRVSLATSASNRERRRSKVHRALEWPKVFVRTIKRNYVRVSPCPDAQTVMHQLSAWIDHYNEVHPHKALGYRSPREFIAAH